MIKENRFTPQEIEAKYQELNSPEKSWLDICMQILEWIGYDTPNTTDLMSAWIKYHGQLKVRNQRQKKHS